MHTLNVTALMGRIGGILFVDVLPGRIATHAVLENVP